MNTDLQEFEKQFSSWKNSWNDRKDLDYLNLESSSRSDLTHNLLVTSYRVDLGNKALFAITKQNCIHILNLRDKLQEQETKLEEIQKVSEIVRSQRRELKLVLENQNHLRKELSLLRADYLQRRPLSRQDVEELVVKLNKQPKLIKDQTEALTEELTKKVDKLEELIHHLRKSIFG